MIGPLLGQPQRFISVCHWGRIWFDGAICAVSQTTDSLTWWNPCLQLFSTKCVPGLLKEQARGQMPLCHWCVERTGVWIRGCLIVWNWEACLHICSFCAGLANVKNFPLLRSSWWNWVVVPNEKKLEEVGDSSWRGFWRTDSANVDFAGHHLWITQLIYWRIWRPHRAYSPTSQCGPSYSVAEQSHMEPVSVLMHIPSCLQGFSSSHRSSLLVRTPLLSIISILSNAPPQLA